MGGNELSRVSRFGVNRKDGAKEKQLVKNNRTDNARASWTLEKKGGDSGEDSNIPNAVDGTSSGEGSIGV